MKKIIKAVIPVRAGSQRVKNKNLREFNEKNLLVYKIEKLKKVKESYKFEGDACDKCGNFTLYKENLKIKCLTCNHEYSE